MSNAELPKPSGRSIRTRNASAGLRERRFDELSLWVNHRRLQTDRRPQPRLLHKECVGVAKDHGSFDDILKFPDIARPVMALQKLRCPLFYPSNSPALFSSVALDEILGQRQNIFRTLAKRGDMDRKDVQPVEQVQAEFPGTNCRGQIAVCGSNYTDVDWNALRAPDALELSFLQHPQQGDLRFARHFTDLIQKHRPVVRDFPGNASACRRLAPVKAPFVAEEPSASLPATAGCQRNSSL